MSNRTGRNNRRGIFLGAKLCKISTKPKASFKKLFAIGKIYSFVEKVWNFIVFGPGPEAIETQPVTHRCARVYLRRIFSMLNKNEKQLKKLLKLIKIV